MGIQTIKTNQKLIEISGTINSLMQASKFFSRHTAELKRGLTKQYSSPAAIRTAVNLENYWMPFTDNAQFKANPKIFTRAEGVHYFTVDGTPIVDGMSGLWCVNAGHGQRKVVEAIKNQAETLDFAPSFNACHELPYKFSEKLVSMLPGKNFGQVFFTMCGSTAVDSALKIALQYQRARGKGEKVRFIGRERGYHGVGFGGISVGGMVGNRKNFSGNMLPFVDHIPHTHSLKDMAFSKGQPQWGAHLAEDLERLLLHHDPSTVAAVIIEPVAGSTGVLPPPVGYLEKVREICTRHDVLLIFDEVITAFGRVGESFATMKFNVTPDMITCAKGLTNAAVPAGAVICQSHIFPTIQEAAHRNPGLQIEFNHGYTYSGHPLAMAAGLATMEVYEEQKIFENSTDLAPYFEKKLHSTLTGLPHVIDIRNFGLMGGIEIQPSAAPEPLRRVIDIFDRCYEKGVLLRYTGSTIACAPPLVSDKAVIDQIVDTLAEAINESATHLHP